MTMAKGFCVSEPMPVESAAGKKSQAGDQGGHHDGPQPQQRSLAGCGADVHVLSRRSLLM